MIYGEIKDLNQYRGISKNLDKAIDYILSGEYKNGVPGKKVIPLKIKIEIYNKYAIIKFWEFK